MIDIDENLIRILIIWVTWVEFLWESYLSLRQLRTAVDATLPKELENVMTEEEFNKAKEYTIAKLNFGVVKDTYTVLLVTAILHYGVMGWLWDYSETINPFSGEISTSCIWCFIHSTISTLLDMPFTIYYTFVLEENFGFNKETAGFFVWDKIKMFVVNQIIFLPLVSIIVYVIKNGGNYFFVWLWVVVCVLVILYMNIYPSVIAPLFDKFTPLPEGELRTQIEDLASQLKFPLTKLYIVEGSKRSSHSNAYFYGLFKSKRIVLYDTLLTKDDGTGMNNEEILGVLSHELGHWSLNHTLKKLFIVQLHLFLLFAGFSFLFKFAPLYKAFGFNNSQPVLAGLYIVIQFLLTPFNTLASFLGTCLSRKFEFQADEFAVQLEKGKVLENALLKLYKDNLGFPVNDRLYSAWHHTHPPLLERMAAIREAMKKTK